MMRALLLLSLWFCVCIDGSLSMFSVQNFVGYFYRIRNTTDSVRVKAVLSQSLIESNYSNAYNTTSTAAKKTDYMMVTFVNGIYHSKQDVENITSYLKDTFRCNVRSFYNPSSGSWVVDAYKAGFDLVLRPSDLILAKKLAEHLRETLRQVREDGGRVLHIAHSGGAILTYLAAKYHLTFSEKSRIDVITLGGGRSLTHKYFRGRLYNYYARNDPLLLVDSRASRLMKMAKNATYALVRDTKHNTTFVYLEAIAKDPLFDHGMHGPTYRKALEWEAEQFRQRLQLLLLVDAKEKDLLRRIRKRAANITGIHHFWTPVKANSVWSYSRKMRKLAANITNFHGVFSGKTYGSAPCLENASNLVDPFVIQVNDSVNITAHWERPDSCNTSNYASPVVDVLAESRNISEDNNSMNSTSLDTIMQLDSNISALVVPQCWEAKINSSVNNCSDHRFSKTTTSVVPLNTSGGLPTTINDEEFVSSDQKCFSCVNLENSINAELDRTFNNEEMYRVLHSVNNHTTDNITREVQRISIERLNDSTQLKNSSAVQASRNSPWMFLSKYFL